MSKHDRRPATEATRNPEQEGPAGQRPDRALVAEAAYYRWQRDGGDPESNWLAAERELGAGNLGGGAERGAGPVGASSPRVNAEPVYTCPMHPEVRQSSPGKCPKCGMALVRK